MVVFESRDLKCRSLVSSQPSVSQYTTVDLETTMPIEITGLLSGLLLLLLVRLKSNSELLEFWIMFISDSRGRPRDSALWMNPLLHLTI